jgi:deazaflavin-dependent oxidoreductase (nitroreductase family)
MPLPKGLAEFNRAVTNHVSRPVAAHVPMFGVVHHAGRRTGRHYATPVNVFPRGDGFVIALTYGAEVDWVRNVVTAGSCVLEHRGRRVRLTAPSFISEQDGMAAMPVVVRAMLRGLDVTRFLELHRATGPGDDAG